MAPETTAELLESILAQPIEDEFGWGHFETEITVNGETSEPQRVQALAHSNFVYFGEHTEEQFKKGAPFEVHRAGGRGLAKITVNPEQIQVTSLIKTRNGQTFNFAESKFYEGHHLDSSEIKFRGIRKSDGVSFEILLRCVPSSDENRWKRLD